MSFGNDSNTIYVGGNFNVVAGKDCTSVASYNLNTRKWTCLTSIVSIYNELVQAIYFNPNTKALMVGGSKSLTLNGISCKGFCVRNASGVWSSFGNFNGSVFSIISNPSSSTEWYACGDFEGVNNISNINFITRWNGTHYLPMSDEFERACFVLAWDSSRQRLYAGGNFNGNFRYWANNSYWEKPSLDIQPNGPVYSIYVVSYSFLLIGGSFTNVGEYVAS